MYEALYKSDYSFMRGQPPINRSVAYCHCNTHKGRLNARMLKKHQCLGKQCPFLEKYEEHPYWEQRRKKKALKKAKLTG